MSADVDIFSYVSLPHPSPTPNNLIENRQRMLAEEQIQQPADMFQETVKNQIQKVPITGAGEVWQGNALNEVWLSNI